MEIAAKKELEKPTMKVALKVKATLIQFCIFLAVTVLALTLLILIDRVLLVVLGLENAGITLSPLFIIMGGLMVRGAFRKFIRQKELQKRTKITAAILLVLIGINLTASFLTERAQPEALKFTPYMIAQSGAYSLPEILIASIPYIGIPLSVGIQVQGIAEERAVSRGENPRDISGEDLLNALFVPPW